MLRENLKDSNLTEIKRGNHHQIKTNSGQNDTKVKTKQNKQITKKDIYSYMDTNSQKAGTQYINMGLNF